MVEPGNEPALTIKTVILHTYNGKRLPETFHAVESCILFSSVNDYEVVIALALDTATSISGQISERKSNMDVLTHYARSKWNFFQSS